MVMRGGNLRAVGGLLLTAALVLACGMFTPRGVLAGDTKFDSDTFGNLSARAIGPAVMGGRIAFVVDAVTDLSSEASESAGKLGADDLLRKSLDGVREALTATQKQLAATKEGGLTGEVKLREKILEVYGGINGYSGKPTESQIAQLGALRKEVRNLEGEYRSTAEKVTATANPELEKKKLPDLKLLSDAEWRKKRQDRAVRS
jgi:hypothetical protein